MLLTLAVLSAALSSALAQTSAPAAPAAKPTPKPAAAQPKVQTSSPATAASAAKSGAVNAPRAVAPGGAPNLVWVNDGSKVYHCYGTRHYGTTQSGKYMSEADAKAQGKHGPRNKDCSVPK